MAGDPTQEPARRSTDNDWMAKAKAAGDFVNKVGMPTVFMLVVLGLGVAYLTGYIESPFVSNKVFLERQQWMEDAHKEQTKKLSEMVNILNRVECDGKPNDKKVADCYRNINGGQP